MSALTWEPEPMPVCTNDGPHRPHRWYSKECPGATPLEALTLPQIEAVANALGVSPWRILRRMAEVYEARRA